MAAEHNLGGRCQVFKNERLAALSRGEGAGSLGGREPAPASFAVAICSEEPVLNPRLSQAAFRPVPRPVLPFPACGFSLAPSGAQDARDKTAACVLETPTPLPWLWLLRDVPPAQG